MSVDLIRVSTQDGCRLDGIWQAPPPGTSQGLGLDGVLLVHGTGGNFYSSTLLEFFAERFLTLGVGTLRVNTRGHDGISTASTTQGGKRLGAAFETVDDCRHDLAAWHDWLRQTAGPRVAWLGHSLGAVKCVYAAAQTPQLAPRLLVAVSPPRLSYSWYCQQPIRAEFLDAYRRAEQLVAAGQPSALVEVAFPLTMAISAAGYKEKYGPDERYNYLPALRAVPCPTLVLFGGNEVANHAAFQQGPEEVARLAAKHPHLATALVEGADHFYTDRRAEAWRQIAAWLHANAKR